VFGIWLGSLIQKTTVRDLRAENEKLKTELKSSDQHIGNHLPSSVQHSAVVSTPPPTPLPAQAPARQTDGVEVMLYFGAFLLFISLLSLGFGNSFSPEGRTILFSVLALISYMLGLNVSRTKKYSEVGLTFLSLGLGMGPLIGFVAQRNEIIDVSGGLLWLVMSILGFTLFSIAIYFVRKSWLGYMTLLVGLSTFLSGFYQLGDIPLYLLAISSMVYALIVAALSDILSPATTVSRTDLSSGSLVLVGTSLMAGLVSSGGLEWGPAGALFISAGVTVAVMTWMGRKSGATSINQLSYQTAAAYCLISAGVVLAVLGLVDSGQEIYGLATVLLVLVGAATVASIWAVSTSRLWPSLDRSILSSFLGLYLLAASGVGLLNAQETSRTALAITNIFAFQALALNYLIDRKWKPSGIAGVAVGLFIPLTLSRALELDDNLIVYAYTAAALLATVVLIIGVRAGAFRKTGLAFGGTVFMISGISAAVLTETSLSRVTIAGCSTLAILAVIGYGLSLRDVRWLARLAFYPYLTFIHSLSEGQYFGLVLVVAALIDYLLTIFVLNKSVSTRPSLDSDHAAIYSAASGGLLLGFYYDSNNGLVMALSLVAAASVLAIESLIYWRNFREEAYYYAEVAGGLVVSAALWLIYKSADDSYLYWYTSIFAIYLAIITRLNKILMSQKDWQPLTLITLGVLTSGLLIDSLSGSDTSISWLLLITQVLIMFYGVIVREKIITYWGLAVASLAVIYQLRDYREVMLGVLGVAVIGAAGFIAYRRESSK
jgi:hypothetical protein